MDGHDLFSEAMIEKMDEKNELINLFQMLRSKTPHKGINLVDLLLMSNLLELGYTPNDRDDFVSGTGQKYREYHPLFMLREKVLYKRSNSYVDMELW